MKYKVGDKVQIKSKEWFDAQEKDEDGDVASAMEDQGSCFFVENMRKYCGKYAYISEIDNTTNGGSYCLDIDDGKWNWQDWMLEDNTK